MVLVLLTLSIVFAEEENQDYYGHDIRSYNRADLTKAACKQDCIQTDLCTRWLFIEGMTAGRNYCWLKNVGATNKRPYLGAGKAFSAPVLREEEQGLDYYGHDIKFYNDYNSATLTKDYCIQDCKQTKACARWMYIEKFSGGRNYCWLKNGGATSSSAYGGEGTAFSGPVYHDEEEGWDYYGNDAHYSVGVTKEQCRQTCEDNNQHCKVWLFIANGEVEGNVLKVGTGRCWVKNIVGERTEWKGEGVAFSALREPAPTTTTPRPCFDIAPHCVELRESGDCVISNTRVFNRCQKTCGFCQ